MRLVDEHQRVRRQIVDQRWRRFARLTAGQEARVIFDPFAKTQLVEHLQIEAGALFDSLRFDQTVLLVEKFDALVQLALDRVDSAQHRGARRHVMRRRKNGEARQLGLQMPGQRIKQLQVFDLVVEKRNSYRVLRVLGRKDVDDVAANAESPAMEVKLVAFVLHFGKTLDDLALPHSIADAHGENHLVILIAIADPVDAGNRCNDHAIASFEQALGRRKPHLFDVLIDRRILLDEQIARRNVGFGLVVIVVGNEVLNRSVRKKLAKLGIELRRQRFVRCQHQRRTSGTSDDVGHGVGFSRPGNAQQGLERQAVLKPLNQSIDRFRLISGGLKRLVQTERAAGKADKRRTFGGFK